MNENQLYRYALLCCCVGFFLLGLVVLFVPISFSDNNSDFIDGEVIAVYPAKNGGQVISIKVLGEESVFMDTDVEFVKGNPYRFYDPTGEDLLFVSDVRALS